MARFPFSFAIAAFGGAFEFIRLVGALTSGILIMGVALVTGYPHGLGIVFESTITCRTCAHAKSVTIPAVQCVFF